jgi:minor histocompatibility antigen H13
MFLGSFQIGAIMLIGLFFYDVFWVFGTDVMETVAKNVDGPIKLLFPKKVIVESNSDMSLLGLGDIVIPGIFIALCLRYDFLRKFNKTTKDRSYESMVTLLDSVSKPYFWSCILGYIFGITATVVIMLMFGRGQPALLYLVPGCLGSVIICAFLRKELTAVYHYSEDDELKEVLDATKTHCGVPLEEEKSDDKAVKDEDIKKVR